MFEFVEFMTRAELLLIFQALPGLLFAITVITVVRIGGTQPKDFGKSEWFVLFCMSAAWPLGLVLFIVASVDAEAFYFLVEERNFRKKVR